MPEVVGELVDRLAADQDSYLGDLLELMREVTTFALTCAPGRSKGGEDAPVGFT